MTSSRQLWVLVAIFDVKSTSKMSTPNLECTILCGRLCIFGVHNSMSNRPPKNLSSQGFFLFSFVFFGIKNVNVVAHWGPTIYTTVGS